MEKAVNIFKKEKKKIKNEENGRIIQERKRKIKSGRNEEENVEKTLQKWNYLNKGKRKKWMENKEKESWGK